MRLTLRNGRLPILDILQSLPTSAEGPEVKAYDAACTPQIDRDRLLYFALSIFWRASVHTWQGEHGDAVRIELGKEYNEDLRRFLLGTDGLPSYAYLSINVCTDAFHQNMFHPPCRTLKTNKHVYSFVACGIDFIFGIGRGVPKELQAISTLIKPEQWITASDCTKDQKLRARS